MRTQSIDPKISKVFGNIDQNRFEVLVDTRYHIKQIPGNVNGAVTIPSELSYFQIKTGQQDDTGYPTTLEDINMDAAGQIGTPYVFWGQELFAFVLPPKASNTPAFDKYVKTTPELTYVNNTARILSRGVVSINILQQPIARVAPIGMIPAGMGLSMGSIFGYDENMAVENVRNGDGPHGYPIDLFLQEQLTFDFKVNFPYGVFPIYTDGIRLGFAIRGFLIRPRQQG